MTPPRNRHSVATPRAVVVGTGPNGLAAAVALARAGCGVTAFEAHEVIGGGTRSEELTLPGFTHDHCSAVHPLGIGSPFFRTLPLAEHGLTWIHPEAPLAHPFEDGTAALLRRSTVETGESLDPADARAGARLLDPFVDRWEGRCGRALRPARVARLGTTPRSRRRSVGGALRGCAPSPLPPPPPPPPPRPTGTLWAPRGRSPHAHPVFGPTRARPLRGHSWPLSPPPLTPDHWCTRPRPHDRWARRRLADH